MLLSDVPAQAICRLRPLHSPESEVARENTCADRQVLNVLGALRMQDQDLRLYHGTSSEPSAARISRIAEAERRLYLAVDCLPGSANAVSDQESGNLVGWLGNVWVLIPCRLTQADAVADPSRVTALLPREAFYVRVRSRPRVSLEGRADAWLEYPASGVQDAVRWPVTDLSEEGVGFALPEARSDLPTFMENVSLRDSTGMIATLDIECVRPPALGNLRAGARVHVIDAIRGDLLEALLAATH